MTPEPLSAEEKQTALRAKYAAKGAFIDGATFKQEEHPVTFSLSLEGLEGTGKTDFIINTMPLPIVLVNFGDRSAIPFLYTMDEERRKQVHIYDVQPSSDEGWTEAEAIASLKELSEIIQAEAPFMAGGTFGLDGGSSWWGTMQTVFVAPKERAAELAGKKRAGGLIYEDANARARGILGFLKNLGCFLAMTHQLKQDWASDGPIPNQFSPKRNSQVPYLMEVVLRLAKFCATCNAPNCQNKDHIGRKHRARLEKLSGNTALEGMWVDNLDFTTLYEFQVGKKWAGAPLPRKGP